MSYVLQTVEKLIAPYAGQPGGLLPALHAIQDHFGFIDKTIIPLIARRFNRTRADVFGVVSFYADFRSEKPNPHIVKICRAEACQAVGAHELVSYATSRNPGDVTFEDVYCLGNCACGPSMMVDGRVYGRVGKKRYEAILKTRREKAKA